MAVAGIIAEYNPLHRGHLYQMEATRAALGADTAILCVMSGNFVQRGEPAVLEKHARAEAAVRCGADLVVELPTLGRSHGGDLCPGCSLSAPRRWCGGLHQLWQ